MAIATAVFRAVADFKGVIAQSGFAAKALSDVEKAARGVGSAGGEIGRGMAQAGPAIAGVGSSLTSKVTLPLAAIGGVAVHTFAQFEKAIVQAGGKADATGAQIEQMKKLAIDMGAQTSFSATEAADAMNNMAAGGLNASQTMKALPGVLLAAQASGEGLALTAGIVTKAMNQFNIKAEDSGHIADVMARAANTTAIDMNGLGLALADAGVLGTSANQSLEDVVASVSRLVDFGVPAASAGAGLRQAMQSLQAPTKGAAEWINKIGIRLRTANGEMKPLPDLLAEMQMQLSDTNPEFQAMASNMGKTTTELRDFVMNQIFGVEGMQAMNLLMSKGKPVRLDLQKDTEKAAALTAGLAKTMGVDAANAFVKAHTKAGVFNATGADAVRALGAMNVAADGTSKKFAKLNADTAAQKLDNLVGSLESLALTIVGAVAPQLKNFIDDLTKLITKIGEWADENPEAAKWAVKIGLVVAAMGPLLLVTGKAITGVTGMVQAFKTAGAAGSNFGKAMRFAAVGIKGVGKAMLVAGRFMLTTPIGLILTAIAVAAFLIIKNWSTVKAFLLSAWSAISSAATTVWAAVTGAITTAWNAVWGVIKAVGSAIATGWTAAWNTIKSVAMAVWNGFLKPVLTAIGTAIKVLAVIVGTLLIAPWVIAYNLLKPIVLALWNGLIKPVFTAIGNFIRQVWGAVSAWVVARATWLYAIWSGIWTAVKTVASAVWNAISSFVRKVWGTLVAWVTVQLTILKVTWLRIWNGIKAVASTVWSAIKTAVSAAWNWIYKTVLGPGLRGLKVIWDTIWNALKRTASTVWNGIKTVIGTVWRTGIKPIFDVLKTAVKAIGTVFDATRKVIGTAWDKVKEAAAKPVRFIVDTVYTKGIKATWDKLAGAVGLKLKLPAVKANFADGGQVHGQGGVDRVPANLTRGEFVMPVRSVKKYGVGMLEAMRQGRLGFREGGFVGDVLGKIGDLGSNVGDWVKDKARAAIEFAKNPAAAIKKLITAPVNNMLKRIGGGDIAKIVRTLPGKVIGGLVTKAKGLAKSILPKIGGAPSGSAQAYAASVLGQYGWGPGEFGPLKALWNGESGWRWNALNASSGAYGIPQSLPASKMASAGADWRTNAATQIRWGLGYIKSRYGSPSSAYGSWLRRSPHWYDQGGWLMPGQLGYNGTNTPEAVFTPKQFLVMKKLGAGLTRPGLAGASSSSPFMPRGGGDDNRMLVFNTTVNNPVAEKTSDSLVRRVTRVGQLGLLASTRAD